MFDLLPLLFFLTEAPHHLQQCRSTQSSTTSDVSVPTHLVGARQLRCRGDDASGASLAFLSSKSVSRYCTACVPGNALFQVVCLPNFGTQDEIVGGLDGEESFTG